MEKKKYLMRSLMFVPGHNDKLQQSASKSDADVILLDLEDSVLPISNKQIARDTIVKNVSAGLFKNYEVFIRINERDSGFLLKDVLQTTILGVTGFLYSKTYNAKDIIFFDKLLETIELEKGFPVGTFKIIPILETASSIIKADEIATASSRNVAIGFGSEDFVSDLQGIRDFEEPQELFTPRAWVAMVARTHNLIPIDAAYIIIHDLEGLEKHCALGRKLGYAGMWTLHPKQNAIPNKFFAPSEKEIAEAYEILKLDEEAQKLGKGVAIINGSFIGPPLVVKANHIIERVKLIKSKQK
ncbi:MAG: citrate lyase subunit beta [Bacteroidetes bacterium RIFOXYA12_FULL_35_11]|nr:MAG: citrate lyase subunit beta [Bacteroidetes bacterium GWF2_35_48]OFY73062.1 MAG: citrate lyase subunit beta [Bacteroidetes bacterium RIFOXYA12_FULL_35_11]OFY94636.1 MAG: citrate lyase subunit beta [Bacteroidetes bacterium RIFOXYC12_FULL_35_7]HBX53540.1 CoA ester lyase [Bacteroidales bacterium]